MSWAEVLLTALGSAGLSAVLVKWMNRRVDNATAEKIRAEAHQVATQAAAAERETRLRLDKIEERERHMLTRAAVHEAWDQLAFAFIAGHDASFPPPPPLRPPTIALPGAEAGPDDN